MLSCCSGSGIDARDSQPLDKRRLGLMPDGAYLINVARGGLVDMDALLAELRKARLKAALDVTDPLEPLPPDHELRRLPNALLTPHIAARRHRNAPRNRRSGGRRSGAFLQRRATGECCHARDAGADDVKTNGFHRG